MYVFLNGFWDGFAEKTDGVHYGPFESILTRVFEQPIHITRFVESADILVESHCSPSMFHVKKWKYSFFFSGEGSLTLPAHAEQYSAVLGALKTNGNHVSCPLFLLYELSTPSTYPVYIDVPPKGICALISSDKDPTKKRFRTAFVDELMKRGIHVDMGGAYKNNVGIVAGQYFEQPILDFQKQYRVVLALENTKLDEYITEKILNPLRAGTVPVYYGSDKVDEYIHSDRIVQVSDIDQTIDQIHRLCVDDDYWLEMTQKPIFVQPIDEVVTKVVTDLKRHIFSTEYSVEVIGNPEKERERMKTLQPILNYYGITPSTTCYGEGAMAHALYNRFDAKKGVSVISLAINHIALLERYATSNQFLVVFESDAIPLADMSVIDTAIRTDIHTMRTRGIDFAFIGKGCFNLSLAETYTNPNNRISDTLYLPRHLSPNGASRCTEAYIVSPNGMRSFLTWFRPRVNHDAIDWSFNHYFTQNPSAIGCWRHPELFMQGSIAGVYSSTLHDTRSKYTTDTINAQPEDV
jgi:hypothetical protein